MKCSVLIEKDSINNCSEIINPILQSRKSSLRELS